MERGLDPSETVALAQAHGWPWTLPRVERVLEMEPEGSFSVRDASGQLVGMATCVVWDRLAWIGGMLVAPSARGRGIARALLQRALTHARARGATSIGLDATPHGRQLYEREGFRPWGESAFWARPPGTPRAPPGPSGDYAIYPVSSCEIMELLDYDRARFGASRARLLARLVGETPHHSFVAVHRKTGAFSGLALRWDERIGPLVADAPEAAAWLLFAIERAGAHPRAIVAGWNPQARAVFEAAGYAPGVATTRMFLGEPLGDAARVFCPAVWSLG